MTSAEVTEGQKMKMADLWPDKDKTSHVKKELFEILHALDQGGTRKRALCRKLIRLTASMFTIVGAEKMIGGDKNGFGMKPLEMELPAGTSDRGMGCLYISHGRS